MNFIDADFISKIFHSPPPLFKIFLPIILSYEIFYFHLLKFSVAKDKITRRNLISESLTDLSDTKRQCRMMGINHVFKIDKNTLRSFWTQVRSYSLFSSTHSSLE